MSDDRDAILFTPFQLGPTLLRNRVVMAPMTRSRSIGNVPGDLVATYYAQRAEAGLIVTEGTSPSPNGLGYARIPGLFTEEQARAWKKVTGAVHAAGGRIFVQLMHTGRVTHPGNLPAGGRVLAPSAIAYAGEMWVDPDGNKPIPTPAAMTGAEIESAIDEYARSGELAMEAGFDGVELHGANGYLIEQFLNTASNARSDEWGGTVRNRTRFAIEVARRVATRIGGDRLGIRLSPYGAFNGMKSGDEGTDEIYESLAGELSKVGLVYVHIVDHSAMGAPPVPATIKQRIRAAFGGAIILSGGYDRDRAEADLRDKRGDLVAFGRPFLANPRLVTKLQKRAPLANPDFATFYTPGEKGYTDYPVDA
jgi:N-ethylmaleimide reductase